MRDVYGSGRLGRIELSGKVVSAGISSLEGEED